MSNADVSAKPNRAPLIDAARGLAVVAMIVFHFTWDLYSYRLIATDPTAHPGWRLFSQGIAASFLVLVGISLERATRDGVRWPSFLRRLALVALAALAITVATSFDTFMADSAQSQFIYFGILHAIATFSVLGLLFRRAPIWLLLLIAAFVMVLPQFWRSDLFDGRTLAWTGLAETVPRSLDFVPLFPWFAFVLIGLAVGKMRLAPLESTAASPRTRLLQFLGRWSLVIYLVHQPLLIGALEAAHALGVLQPMTVAGTFERQCNAECRANGANAALCAQVCGCTVSNMQQTGLFRPGRTLGEADRSAISRITQACMASYTPRP